MTRALPRTHFHSSDLLRCLVDLTIVDAVEPASTFAEKLGLWMHFTEAITLSAVHTQGMASMPTGVQDISPVAIGLDFDRIRADLGASIKRSCSPDADMSGSTHIKLPLPPIALPFDPAAAYGPYRRFYDAHQRDMELRLQPLRSTVRQALARTSPRLAKLAELDAVFERIVRERERQLLATVPVLLKKRFEQLFKAHQQWLTDRQLTDNPTGWTSTGGWLAHFCDDLRMVLLAELALRLQPALGLIEALNDHTGTPNTTQHTP